VNDHDSVARTARPAEMQDRGRHLGHRREMRKPASRDLKVVPIADARERRRARVAREHWAAATESVPEGPDAASNFTMLGNIALIDGLHEDAITAFSRALELAPKDVSARTGRGRARAALGEHALALSDFDAALLAGDTTLAHLGRSGALAMLGRLEEAVAATSRAISAAPDRADAYYTRAVYRSQLDADDPGVRADLDRAVELAPKETSYLRARAEHRRNAEEFDLAASDFDHLVALRPEDATMHYLRGKCLLDAAAGALHAEMPRFEAALVSLERGLELAPNDGQLRSKLLYAIVCVCECMNDTDAHLAALDRAIEEMPNEAPLLHVRADRRRRRGDAAGAASDLTRLKDLGIKL